MSKNVKILNIDNVNYDIRPYAICSTASNVRAKTVALEDFNIFEGATILVKFTYACSSDTNYNKPTLSINSGTAYPIYYRDSQLDSSTEYWKAKDILELRFNGTQWDIITINSNTTYSKMTTDEYTAGTSTTGRLVSPKDLKTWIDDACNCDPSDSEGDAALIEVAWADLVTMVDNGGLTPGAKYAITDYTTKVSSVLTDCSVAGHDFDVIVTALDYNVLSEDAEARRRSSDNGYFEGQNLNAWKLKYCIYNDTDRFSWATEDGGTGVIYRMIDEYGNDLPYDFKNILFKRYKITETQDYSSEDLVNTYFGVKYNDRYTISQSDYIWCYTFSYFYNATTKNIIDASLQQPTGSSRETTVFNNKYSPFIGEDRIQRLNNGVALSLESRDEQAIMYDTVTGANCYDWTCGINCHSWSCGSDCNNWFCNDFCVEWSCENNCCHWLCMDGCSDWSCMNNCSDWFCGGYCSSWTCGSDCSNWFCRLGCSIWSCESNCSGWTCGEYSENWSCGNSCYGWSCADKCSHWSCGNYCCDWYCGENCNHWSCGNSCYDWECKNNCSSWSCGDDCDEWICWENCKDWSCGNNCNQWTCGGSNNSWICGNSCSGWEAGINGGYWTCGDNCVGWVSGKECAHWSCGDNCNNWSCGEECYHWSCGDKCSEWTCENNCSYWTCGNMSSYWVCGNNCENWVCGNNCGDWLVRDNTYNFTILDNTAQGLVNQDILDENGHFELPLIYIPGKNLYDYSQIIGVDSKGIVKAWLPVNQSAYINDVSLVGINDGTFNFVYLKAPKDMVNIETDKVIFARYITGKKRHRDWGNPSYHSKYKAWVRPQYLIPGPQFTTEPVIDDNMIGLYPINTIEDIDPMFRTFRDTDKYDYFYIAGAGFSPESPLEGAPLVDLIAYNNQCHTGEGGNFNYLNKTLGICLQRNGEKITDYIRFTIRGNDSGDLYFSRI